MIERPLDLLNSYRGKNVLIECIDGKTFSGELLAFDLNINVVLANMRKVTEEGELKIKYGDSLIRGDKVNFISCGEQ